MYKKQKIMIVDCGQVYLTFLRGVLEDIGAKIIITSSVDEAVTKVDDLDIELIIVIQIQGIDVYEMIKRIRKEEINKFIPILILSHESVHSEEFKPIKRIHSGIIDFIKNSDSQESIIGKIKLLLEMQNNRKELEKKNELLKENAKDKNLFLAAMSHEIRTPMNAILGSTHLLKKAKTRIEQKQYIDIIETSGDLLLGIINIVLDYSKLEAGKSTVLNNCFSLEKTTSELYSILVSIAEEKGLEFTVLPDTDLTAQIVGDDVRLKQILLNLCNNAFKYTNKGSVILKIEKKSESKTTIRYKFSIVDTGVGILKDDISDLFKPFSQFNAESNYEIEGTGLGLSIVKNTVDLLGGKLGVESIRGFGSTFWFELKFKKLFKKERRNTSSKYRDKFDEIKKSLRILIADNDKFSRIIVEKILVNDGFKLIDTVENGQEAVKLHATNIYDVIFMDRMMPIMNGLEATTVIRNAENNNKRTHIIALSADALNENRKAYYNAGIDYFLLKPINHQTLDDIIRDIILNYYIPDYKTASKKK